MRYDIQRAIFICAATLYLVAGIARADDKQVIDDLRARVEALEKQNRELLDAFRSGRLPHADQSLVGANEVKQLVGDYLKELDERQKKAEADKKAKEAAEGVVVGSDLGMKVKWDNGMWAETADKAFRVHVGGRVQGDAVWMTADDRVQYGKNGTGRIDDGVNFRRARLAVEGTFHEVIDFNCEFDFANTLNTERTGDPLITNVPVPTDVWLTFAHLPVIGNVRVGNQKPPLSLSHVNGDRYLNFLERSFAFDAFIGGLDNGFRPGVQVFNSYLDQRVHAALGVFKNNTTPFGWNVGDGEYDLTGRLTCLPIYEDDGSRLLHLGVGASHRDLDDDQARFRARTLLRNGPGALQTALLDVRLLGGSQDLVVPELAIVVGPLLIQTEYYAVWVRDAMFPITPAAARVNRGTVYFQSYYVEVLYFLTGEHRAYNRRNPGFTRVVPNENFFFVNGADGQLFGRGAWQVGVRYSYLDLENRGIAGGTLHDITLGLNWFFNPNAKLQWDYSWTHRDVPGRTSDGNVQGFGMRLAFDF